MERPSLTASRGQAPLPMSTTLGRTLPMSRAIHNWGAYDVHCRQPQVEEPLIYLGVSLHRPPNCPSSMILFPFDQSFLVIGNIEQHLMQCFTVWAWATTCPPRTSGPNFRSCFHGSLYPTSILQLIPGDVMISINGLPVASFTSDQLNRILCCAQHLDILAVRTETARREAQHILSTSMAVPDCNFRAAQCAFQSIRPLLAKNLSPVQLQPPMSSMRPTNNHSARSAIAHNKKATAPLKRAISEVKNPWFRNEKGEPLIFHDAFPVFDPSMDEQRASQFIRPISSFPEWLAKRKATWREMRSKRKSAVAFPGRGEEARAKRRRCNRLIYLAFKLERNSTAESWGLSVSLLEKYFLGIGHVQEFTHARTKWARATASPITWTLLNTKEDKDIQQFFERKPDLSCSPFLLCGDMIVSINGRPVSSFLDKMSGVTAYLRTVTSLTVLVLRDEHAYNSTIQHAANEVVASTNSHEKSYFIAANALRSMLPALHSSPTLVDALCPNNKAEFYMIGLSSQLAHSGKEIVPHASPMRQVPMNSLFRDGQGNPIPYEDGYDYDPDGESFVHNFLNAECTLSFSTWSQKRKNTWRKGWNVHAIQSDSDSDSEDDDSPLSVSSDFWSQQGYASFQHWLSASTFKWKQTFTWNRKKRARLEKEYEEVVHFPSTSSPLAADEFQTWLRVRKHQWRFLRRKRQRFLEEQDKESETLHQRETFEHQSTGSPSEHDACSPVKAPMDSKCRALAMASPRSVAIGKHAASGEMIIIDALLAEEELQRRALEERPPMDIRFLFDAKLGAPDDVVAHCLSFLHHCEHGKLLCVSATTSRAIKKRDELWRQLCPSRWVLPRRPRKPWHELYITKIRQEEETSRKKSDALLTKAEELISKSDQLQAIQKLVESGERRFGFDVNYVSGVVCERNSLVNLAAAYCRPKIVRWLVEAKDADIESGDRGNFTPLLSAAWAGDRYLVRFLLSHGADRTKVGTNHFFEPLAPPEFKGLNAAGWARRKGHNDLANLIALGL